MRLGKDDKRKLPRKRTVRPESSSTKLKVQCNRTVRSKRKREKIQKERDRGRVKRRRFNSGRCSANYQRPFKSRVTSKRGRSRLLISGSPGTLMPGVDAGNGRYREPTRQGLRPAEILQALTQLLTHAQHTKLHRMLTTRVCNTVYHQCSLYQTLFTAQRLLL